MAFASLCHFISRTVYCVKLNQKEASTVTAEHEKKNICGIVDNTSNIILKKLNLQQAVFTRIPHSFLLL